MYKGTMNKNADVVLREGFPELVPGENRIDWSGDIVYVEVIPRWWTL